jgi:predicted ATPase
MFLGQALIFQGWALAQRGQLVAAVAQIREGLTATRVIRAHGFEPIFLGILAEALALTGAIAGGLDALADALVIGEASGQRWADAELHRLRGELLQSLPSPHWAEVEACFRRALDIARAQGTRGFELRAAVSLARLLSERGCRSEAHELLAPVYGWFTEGFDAPDLKEAKALLEALP